jgi:O-antigen ligase
MGKSQFLLWAAVMIYYLMTEVISGVLGNMRSFEIGMFYAPIVFTAVALLASSDIQKTYIALRWILLVPLLGSLIAMVVAPHLVLETGYKGFIPGISFRLAGLTEHANSLGVIAAIALLLEFSKFVCKKPNVVFSLISFANLILAQSKTAWVIVIIGIVMINFNTYWKGDLQTRRQGNSLAIVTGVLIFAAFAGLIFFLKADSLQDLIASDRSGLTTFTGRTKIWEITWNEFLNNPLSGYGPSIWDLQFRFQHGMMHVGQAHSQYMQTIGQAGLLGAVALAFYIYLLVSRSYQGWNETNGFSFLMVLVLLIRGFSESPMRMSGILDFDGFTHLLAFLSVAALTMSAREKKAELSLT